MERVNVSVLEAVLWDHDGTLVDTEPYWIEAELELAAEYDVPWTKEHAVATVGSPMSETARRMQETGLPMENGEIVLELSGRVVRLIDEKGIRWLPGVRELLSEIAEAGIRNAIVSNAWRSVVEKTVAALPEGSFEFILTGDEMEHAKPDPWPYLTAAEALGVSHRHVVVIEDSLSGTMSAEAAEMPVLVVPNVNAIPAAPGRVLARSLADVSLDSLRAIVAGEGQSVPDPVLE